MRALTSCALNATLVQALETQWHWQVDTVDSISAATENLSADDRAAVRAILVETEPVTAELMDALPNLEVIAVMRSEPVNVDITAATERALPVIHTPGRNAESVADFTLGLTLAMLRNIAITHHSIMSGDITRADSLADEIGRIADVIWRPDDPAEPIPYIAYKGRELSSLVIGVIGYGAVGRAVARRFRPLVREVMVVDPAVPESEITTAGFTATDLASMLAQADVVTVHARSASVIIGDPEISLDAARLLPHQYRTGDGTRLRGTRPGPARRAPARRGPRCVPRGTTPADEPPALRSRSHAHTSPGRRNRGGQRTHVRHRTSGPERPLPQNRLDRRRRPEPASPAGVDPRPRIGRTPQSRLSKQVGNDRQDSRYRWRQLHVRSRPGPAAGGSAVF